MNQNTTIEATETKMDHVSVISIKKGSIWAQLSDFADSPFKYSVRYYLIHIQDMYCNNIRKYKCWIDAQPTQ